MTDFNVYQNAAYRANLFSLKSEIKSLAYKRICMRKEIKRLGASNSRLSFKEFEKKEDFILANSILMENLRYKGSFDARHHHLAYGFLRDVPYLSMERTCKIPPNPEEILKIIHNYCGYHAKKDWTIERVKKLLGPPSAFDKIKDFIKQL